MASEVPRRKTQTGKFKPKESAPQTDEVERIILEAGKRARQMTATLRMARKLRHEVALQSPRMTPDARSLEFARHYSEGGGVVHQTGCRICDNHRSRVPFHLLERLSSDLAKAGVSGIDLGFHNVVHTKSGSVLTEIGNDEFLEIDESADIRANFPRDLAGTLLKIRENYKKARRSLRRTLVAGISVGPAIEE